MYPSVTDTLDPPPDRGSKPLSAGLYLVATPIGNLGDITLRAIDTLRGSNLIACEDTRVTGKLLKHLGISGKLVRYDDHSEAKVRDRLLGAAAHGPVALVSDAGSPLVSDPGYRLVEAARKDGITTTAIPGPSAVVAGLSLSGLPNDRFLFAGFMPSKDKARQEALTELASLDATLIFFDTAPRLQKTLAVIEQTLPDREVAVARELTKLHEEVRRGLPSGLMAWFDAHPPKGEIVLLIAPPGEAAISDAEVDDMLHEALKTHKTSQAAAEVARVTGRERKMLYNRAMELRDK